MTLPLENGIKMKLALLTSNSLRHKYIAHCLGADLKLVITEEKSPAILDTSAYGAEDAEFISQHFADRSKSETKFFATYEKFPDSVKKLQLSHGGINTPEAIEAIDKAAPDFLVLFGSSIVKQPLLSKYEDRILNLHLGLSPYYRGSATNLYPYLFEEPECVGATIHLATNEVDKGQILHQLRPEMKETDSLHDIGNRTILEAGKILSQIIIKYESGEITPISRNGHGRFTRNKDITPYVLREIYKNFERGMIPQYLKNKEKRDKNKPIVERKV